MIRIYLNPRLITAVLLLAVAGATVGAVPGSKSAPVIDIGNATVTVTNGAATCCVDDTDDKVELSSAGAVDTDECGGESGNRIDETETRWHATVGALDVVEGKTNEWLATGTGLGTIFVYFNDFPDDDNDKNDDDIDYDDAESAAKTVSVTGFKVGCRLTTNKGGSYTRYHDGTTAGSTGTGLSGTIGWSNSSHKSNGRVTETDAATATWTVVVVPAGTAMKGDVKIAGDADTTAATTVSVQTQDTDTETGADPETDPEAGSHSVTCPVTYNAAFTYSNDFGGDNAVANASAAVAFQSDAAWLATKTVSQSDSSRTASQAAKSSSFEHSAATAYYTGKENGKRNADFRAGYQTDISESVLDSADATVTTTCKWRFSVPENAVYVSP